MKGHTWRTPRSLTHSVLEHPVGVTARWLVQILWKKSVDKEHSGSSIGRHVSELANPAFRFGSHVLFRGFTQHLSDPCLSGKITPSLNDAIETRAFRLLRSGPIVLTCIPKTTVSSTQIAIVVINSDRSLKSNRGFSGRGFRLLISSAFRCVVIALRCFPTVTLKSACTGSRNTSVPSGGSSGMSTVHALHCGND